MSSRGAADRPADGSADPLADLPRSVGDVVHAVAASAVVARARGEQFIERGVFGLATLAILLVAIGTAVAGGTWLVLSALVSAAERWLGDAALARGVVGLALIVGPFVIAAALAASRARRRRATIAASVDELLGNLPPTRSGRTLADLEHEARARTSASGRAAVARMREGLDPRSLLAHHPGWIAATIAAAAGVGWLVLRRPSPPDAPIAPAAPATSPPPAPDHPFANALSAVIAHAGIMLLERYLPPAAPPSGTTAVDRGPTPAPKAT